MISKKNDSNYLIKSQSYKGFSYTVLTKEMYDYHHTTTFKMLKQISQLFEVHKIKYIIVGGTLLGAYTLNTFIPWDDDADIAVFEEDYERAMTVLEKNISNNYCVQSKRADSNYYLGWAKVRDKKSHVYPDAPLFKENGVWVDIYKLSLIKKKDYKYLSVSEDLNYLQRRYKVGGLTKTEYKSRMKKQHLKFKKLIYKFSSIFNNDKEKVYLIMSASKITIKTDWVFPLKTYLFNGLKLFSINKADLYLEEHYGKNFHMFPPESLRRVGINKIEYW